MNLTIPTLIRHRLLILSTWGSISLMFLAVILVSSSLAFGQKPQATPDFDIADFNKKMDTVEWLVAYDEVAWKTSDVVVTEDKSEVAKLGREWFCIQDP